MIDTIPEKKSEVVCTEKEKHACCGNYSGGAGRRDDPRPPNR